MEATPATSEDLDELVAMWVDLAAGQRQHGSHIVADSNRDHVREILSHAVVADEVLVARTDGEPDDLGGESDAVDVKNDGAIGDQSDGAVGDESNGAVGDENDGAVEDENDGATGELLGFATISLEQGRYVQDCIRGSIDNLFVRPSERDRGIGELLLESAEERLHAAGASIVALEAMADNEGARRFYRRHGYELHRVELEKRLDRDDDLVGDGEASAGNDTDT